MDLKKGDIVTVRPRLKGGYTYGATLFVDDMEEFRSKSVEITDVRTNNKYRIAEDKGRFVWDLAMFTEESINKAKEKYSKFKVGDIVIGNERASKRYHVTTEGFIGEVVEIKPDTYTIDLKEKDGSKIWYGLDQNCFNLLTGEEETEKEETEMENVDMKELAKAINKLTKEVKREDPFKQAMLEGIIEKGKELATEDLKKELKDDLDKFIQETYGNIPKKIKIERGTKTKELEGIFHKDFEKICKIVDSNIPLMLVGGAGAGKNYTLEQVAQALDLTFYTTNAVNQDYKLTGFIDANGKYHETEFYKAFVNGGMFFLDEIDASCPEALVTLNSAIANKYFDFPVGRMTAHKDFRVVCAGNTYGTGADMVYVGRNVLDGATLDRFVVLEFDYDDEVEKQLAYDDDLYKFIKDLRNAVNKAGLRYIVSMRALINSTKLLEIGVDKNTILKTTVIKNMQRDDLNTVINKLEITSSDWYKELKRLCD